MTTEINAAFSSSTAHDNASEHSVLKQFRSQLYDYRFWVVQGLVLLATGFHWTIEHLAAQAGHEFSTFYVVATYAVYFVPVIYASLHFGRAGAIPTAIWAALLSIPNVLIWHQGMDRLAEMIQLLTIIALAVVIASRVDREVAARRKAEREEQSRRLSEARYHDLFETVGEAIVVFDDAGIIRESNLAAARLLDSSVASPHGQTLSTLLGQENAKRLIRATTSDSAEIESLCLIDREEQREIWVEPICTVVSSNGNAHQYQALLRNVTVQRQRQHGLETYARRTIQAQEEERQRIARELHDSTLQSIILLYRELDQLESLSADDAHAVSERLGAARAQTEAIADELRRYSRDLRPSILDDLGLVAAIRWLAKDLESRSGVHVRFLVEGTIRRLSPDEELGMFRIAQEAMRNVERHATASTVTVTSGFHVDRVSLTVHDDGEGFDVEQTLTMEPTDQRLGLLGMQERARLIGGRLTITSNPGHGTCVQIELPMLNELPRLSSEDDRYRLAGDSNHGK